MLPSRGLLFHRSENAWYHISSRGPTTKLRRIDRDVPTLIFHMSEDRERLQEFLDRSDIYSVGEIAVAVSPYIDFPSRGFPHEDRDKWLEVTKLLVEAKPSSLASELPANPLPITRLRRFYEMLRLFPTTAVHHAIVGHLAKGVDSVDILDALFADSLIHLDGYSNVNEAFRPAGARAWWPEYLTKHDQFAHCLVAHLNPTNGSRSIRTADANPMEFAAVDYEISPLRTTGGRKFEDGTPARKSGAGGVDLLCATPDGFPVIGEVKAPTDTSLFVALVQSLTYAGELLTPQQIARLKKAYPNHFSVAGAQVVGELLLLVRADDRPRLEDETLRLAESLLANPDGSVAKHVRRISVLNVEFHPSSTPAFTLRHSVQSSYNALTASGQNDRSQDLSV
jgi:hypothetical protein